MTKKRKLTTSEIPPPPLKTTPIQKGYIHFRFDHFDGEHPFFKDSAFDSSWPVKLLTRLKAFQRVAIEQFKTCMAFRQSQYVHEIEWDSTNLDSFNIHQGQEYDEDAWQFGLSKAKGRIHGFFIGDFFYIVWLDPEHRLFDFKNPADN